MSTAAHPVTFSGLLARAPYGAVAGLVGGAVFGVLMAMRGMLSMIAMLANSESVGVGWVVHLAIALAIGALFAVLVATAKLGPLLGAGAVYGVVWWVLGPLVIMPAWLGMPLFMVNTDTWLSLLGHVIYGLVAAAVLYGLRRRIAHA